MGFTGSKGVWKWCKNGVKIVVFLFIPISMVLMVAGVEEGGGKWLREKWCFRIYGALGFLPKVSIPPSSSTTTNTLTSDRRWWCESQIKRLAKASAFGICFIWFLDQQQSGASGWLERSLVGGTQWKKWKVSESEKMAKNVKKREKSEKRAKWEGVIMMCSIVIWWSRKSWNLVIIDSPQHNSLIS